MEEEREEREKRRTGENTGKNGNVYKAIEKIKTEGYVCIVNMGEQCRRIGRM